MIIRLLNLWPLVVTMPAVLAQWFRPPAFDCSRIPQRWCCSPRVRDSCPQLCTQPGIQCGPRPPPPSPFGGLLPNGLGLPLSGLLGGLPQLPNLLPTQPPPAVWNRPQPPHPQPQGGAQPPPGLVLPPVGTPLAVGTGIEQPGSVQPPRPSGRGAVDGFVSSRGISSGSAVGTAGSAAVGAGGSFGPEVNGGPDGLPPVDPPPPPFAVVTPSTFPTLINTRATPLPPSVAPPWAQTPPTAPPPSGLVDSNAKTRGRGILPPPNRFSSTGEDKLVELEEQDGRVVQVPAERSTALVPQAASSDRVANGIANTLIVETPAAGSELTLPPLITPPTSSSTAAPLSAAPPPTSAEFAVSPDAPRTTLPDGGAAWSFKISPSKQRTFAESRDLPPPEFAAAASTDKRIGQAAIGGSNRTHPAGNSTLESNGLLSGNRLNNVIDSLITKKTIDAISSFTGKRPPKRPKSRAPETTIATSSVPVWINATTPPSRLSSFSPAGGVTSAQCGTAPDFRPCVPLERANDRLLQCCRSKFMPEGCLSLCRYDTTQAQVKKAFDAGKCGILNVAPFLDCASQAQDNRACCTERQLAKKSGPQCEVFCHPRDGLALNLQHLVCQNVISDLLQCHHSGLKF